MTKRMAAAKSTAPAIKAGLTFFASVLVVCSVTCSCFCSGGSVCSLGVGGDSPSLISTRDRYPTFCENIKYPTG